MAKTTTKRTPPKRVGSMTSYIDGLIMQGITWERLAEKAKAEAEARGLTFFTKLAHLKSHARFRAKQSGWWIEMDDVGVRGRPPAKPEPEPKPAKTPVTPKAQSKAEVKPTGRKTRKVVAENGRQTIEPAPEPETTA